MENSIETFVIQEQDLELVIQEQKLGALTTNAKDIKSLIEKALPNYDIANYNESNIDVAKKDKALLNKSSKLLNDKRIELEKQFMAPFTEFKEIITETCKIIKTATDKIDVVVKDSESKVKDSKRKLIKEYWDSKEFTLVSLVKIFDEKWLNKTSKIKDIQSEIDTKIAKINDDFVTLDAIGTDVEDLKAHYLISLDINATIQHANILKLNREKLQPKAAEVSEPVKKENVATSVLESNTDLLVRFMKVTATYDQLVFLGNFMNDNNITFEKLENGNQV